jgi:DNA replication protein DnaC
VPIDGYLRHGRCFYRAPERLVHERVELCFDRDQVWIVHRGVEVARYPRSHEQGLWLPPPIMRPGAGRDEAAADAAAADGRAAGAGRDEAAADAAAADGRAAGAGRLRGAVRVSKRKLGERLPYLLGELKAPRVLERLEQTAALAREQSWPDERFLETLLEAEVFARDASGARTRIRDAAFPALKTLADFDWSAQPSAEKPLVLYLAQLAWIDEQANVCFLGPPGTGTSHLAIALGLEACERGFRVAFATAQEWVSRLEQAQDRNQLEQEPRRLERYQLLIVDEVGSLPLERQAANLLFALVSRRDERGSIILTSNRGFEQWGEILGDAMVAAALIDRLVHHVTMIALKGTSYRLRERGLDSRSRRSGSVAPRLRLNGGSRIKPIQARIALSAALAAKLEATGAPLTPPTTRPYLRPSLNWCTFRLRKPAHFSLRLTLRRVRGSVLAGEGVPG